MVLVGANVAVARVLADALPIPILLFLRCLLASLILLPFIVTFRPSVFPPRSLLGNLILQAALGTLLYNIALLAGLRRTGALEGGLVLASLPAVVAVGAWLLLGERLPPRRWAAAGLAALAMAALTLGRASGVTGSSMGSPIVSPFGSPAGDGLVFLAVCGEAAYALLSKRIAGLIGVVQATFWMQVFSATLLAPLALPLLDYPMLAGMGWRIGGLLVFHSLTASVLSLLLWYNGMKRAPASLAGIFTAFLPATAAVLAILVLHEQPTLAHAAALMLMLLSMLLAGWS